MSITELVPQFVPTEVDQEFMRLYAQGQDESRLVQMLNDGFGVLSAAVIQSSQETEELSLAND